MTICTESVFCCDCHLMGHMVLAHAQKTDAVFMGLLPQRLGDLWVTSPEVGLGTPGDICWRIARGLS